MPPARLRESPFGSGGISEEPGGRGMASPLQKYLTKHLVGAGPCPARPVGSCIRCIEGAPRKRAGRPVADRRSSMQYELQKYLTKHLVGAGPCPARPVGSCIRCIEGAPRKRAGRPVADRRSSMQYESHQTRPCAKRSPGSRGTAPAQPLVAWFRRRIRSCWVNFSVFLQKWQVSSAPSCSSWIMRVSSS